MKVPSGKYTIDAIGWVDLIPLRGYATVVDKTRSVRLTPGMMTWITKRAMIEVEKGTTLDLFRLFGDDFGPRGGIKETEKTR